MDIKEFQIELFQKGLETGFSEIEVYYSFSKATAIKVFNGEIDEYYIAEQGGISFRGLFDGKMGYSYAEKIEKESISLLLEEASNNAGILEKKGEESLFEGSAFYEKERDFPEALGNIDPDLLIEFAMNMEKAAFTADDRVQSVPYCGVSKSESEVMIVNTKGLNCYKKTAFISANLSVLANDGEQTATGGESDFTSTDFSELNCNKIAKRAVYEAVSKLGARSIETAVYPVIFRFDAAAELLASYTGLFSAEAVQKGYSKFKDKINKQVAGDNITFIDDPLMDEAPGYATFDSEGYATKRKKIIENGKLLTFLHNRQTALTDKIESTGNARKSSYRSTISIGPFNLYVQPGEASLQEIMATVEEGIMIVELGGLNSGINGVSGDFSLSAIGFLIQNGKVIRPVNQIAVSGNFFELLNNIDRVANDLQIRGTISSPSIKVNALSISGNL
ncbi:TldD/PmbA family protein [Metabacillus fastidiosus]|uniref:TldD/PmbA family protein n=1 Tax=Metabacillus fastidiosus TaxID=1458 RepID=UPI002E2319FB|nr:TldD/PmbA family protein [Metabacillus fastidiosus]